MNENTIYAEAGGNLISEIMPENATYIKISKDLSKGFDYRKIEVTK